MSRLPVRQSVAERWTRVAFACAIVAALGTAVIFVLPASKPPQIAQPGVTATAPAERKPPKAPSEGVSKEWPTLTSAVDGLNAPAVAMWIEEQKRIKEAAQGNEGAPTGGPAIASSGFAPPWRYLGSISDGEQRVALVVIDTKQRFIREGFFSDEGYRVVAIEAERIVVEQGSARHEIHLEESTRGGGLGNTAAAQPRPAPFRVEVIKTAEGGVRTASGDTSERALRTDEPLSVERARQGLRGTPVQPAGGGGGGR